MAEPGSRERVLEALKPLGLVMARPELGGTGLLLNGSVFGVLHSGLVYLKVDKKQREEYHEAGMRPLEPRPRQKLDAFLQVPLAIVEDDAKLLEHAARAAGRPVPKTPPAPRRGATTPPGAEEPSPAQPSKPARTARAKPAKTKE
ncbi:MAG TPA: TfoX/Sxy family protein [Candidatus Dormibacteraeota bacterium]